MAKKTLQDERRDLRDACLEFARTLGIYWLLDRFTDFLEGRAAAVPCWNWRNWTFGVCWDQETITIAIGPFGLIVDLPLSRDDG